MPGEFPGVPYFMISYPHTEHNGTGSEPRSQRDPDVWVERFYRNLCLKVEELTAVPPGTGVGVFDRDCWVGEDWVEGLPEALASCRVLVPLYSRGYFRSSFCGKEWQAFATRSAGTSAQISQAPAIVPVMWSPMAPGEIHQTVRTVPVEFGGIESYEREGLYGLLRRENYYRDDYDKVVRLVAQRIVATARRAPRGPWPLPDLKELRNPFAGGAVPKSGVPRLFTTVVAPQQDDLPDDRRDERYYGPAAWHWAPYGLASPVPIAAYTADFARSMEYQPWVSDLGERARELCTDGLVAGPELLIIDPWAVTQPACRRVLAQCNLADKPWVQVVIPWNPDDQETASAEGRLRQALDAALGQKLAHGRVISAVAVRGVPSIGTYRAVLPLLILTAVHAYLDHAPAFPPEGLPVEKPTLHGFAPSPACPLERAGA